MNETARNRLLTKLSSRKGPVVQMGFGLHAGKAVQGAIGSQRKLDATYISEVCVHCSVPLFFFLRNGAISFHSLSFVLVGGTGRVPGVLHKALWRTSTHV